MGIINSWELPEDGDKIDRQNGIKVYTAKQMRAMKQEKKEQAQIVFRIKQKSFVE